MVTAKTVRKNRNNIADSVTNTIKAAKKLKVGDIVEYEVQIMRDEGYHVGHSIHFGKYVGYYQGMTGDENPQIRFSDIKNYDQACVEEYVDDRRLRINQRELYASQIRSIRKLK